MPGEPKLYDLATGKYDVTVKVGPSYATQREETREMLIEIMSRVDGAAPLIGDILMEHMDFQGADKVAKRLKSILPPAIQQAEAESEDGDVPPAAAAALKQSQATIQQLQLQLQQMQAALEAKGNDEQAKRSFEDRKLALEERRLKIEEDNAVLQRDHTTQKLNDERSQATGLPPNGQPPEDKFAQLIEMLGGLMMTIAEQNAQTQAQQAQTQVLMERGFTEMARALAAPKKILRDGNHRATGVAIDTTGMH